MMNISRRNVTSVFYIKYCIGGKWQLIIVLYNHDNLDRKDCHAVFRKRLSCNQGLKNISIWATTHWGPEK